ncbi:MAG: ATP-binding protein [Clostridia bacterium]|nr:ATP-binding protein [Clostridia bacterium]
MGFKSILRKYKDRLRVVHGLNISAARLFLVMLILMASFFAGTGNIFAEESSKNILILNSYHKGLTWTDEETEGITEVIKSTERNCTIAVEYMDWKNYSTKENLDRLVADYKYKYANKKIDLIVTTDDAALGFALNNRLFLFSNAPIVFCGVNRKGAERLIRQNSNVTGVLEEVDPEKTIRAALNIQPDMKEIHVLFDNTESGLSTGELTIQTIHRINPEIRVKTLNEKRLEEILKEVGQASEKSAILITTYYTDIDGSVVGFEKMTELVSKNSNVPVYHLYDFGIGYGVIGGSMLSGRLQGENAGKIAVRVLKGENISQIPISSQGTIHYMFDYIQLQRFGISLDQIPKDSQVINKPFSFYETYKNIVITAGAIFVLLVTFIGILILYLGKINRMKQELQKNHVQLTRLYEDLKYSENKLKQQYEELSETQRNLLSSETRYVLLFEKMLNGFLVFEPVINYEGILEDLRFLKVNPGFEKQSGMKIRDVLGKTWMEAFRAPNRELSILHRILQTGEGEQFETYYKDKYYLVNAFKISDGHIGVIFDNITAYKKAIREIRKLNEELEQRVENRTSELRHAISELEAFTYTVSHDLKSPLRAVDGYCRIYMEDYGEKIEDEAAQIIGNIRNICKDMIEMIQKLLQYSTTSRAGVHKEEVQTEELISSVFEELKSSQPQRNLQLNIETGLPVVHADRVLLKQAVYNILSNAVKFTKNRDKAVVTVGSTLTEEEYMFYFKDNGTGFDMEFSGKLFGLFQRLHTADEFEGSGIGLVTIRKIIQKHGGRTWIEGKVDEGATVYFTLPLEW